MRTLRLARTASTLGLLAIAAAVTLAIADPPGGARPVSRGAAATTAHGELQPTRSRAAGGRLALPASAGELATAEPERIDPFHASGLGLAQAAGGPHAAAAVGLVAARPARRWTGPGGRAPPLDLPYPVLPEA